MVGAVGTHGPVLGPQASLFLDVLLLGAAVVLLFTDRRLTVPSATVLFALVAACAAGRVATADLPNVQPVSVMVLLAGATMGARRGVAFAVLVTMLSNAVLGDGVWTIFQAVGWALMAFAGSKLDLIDEDGALLLGRSTTLTAALAIPFGALTTLSVLGPDVGMAALPALLWSGLPFDVAHALGNVVLMLWAGPSIVRWMTLREVGDPMTITGLEADASLV
jgi:energy-coupling factor transport system substrate-specific component